MWASTVVASFKAYRPRCIQAWTKPGRPPLLPPLRPILRPSSLHRSSWRRRQGCSQYKPAWLFRAGVRDSSAQARSLKIRRWQSMRKRAASLFLYPSARSQPAGETTPKIIASLRGRRRHWAVLAGVQAAEFPPQAPQQCSRPPRSWCPLPRQLVYSPLELAACPEHAVLSPRSGEGLEQTRWSQRAARQVQLAASWSIPFDCKLAFTSPSPSGLAPQAGG